METKVSLIRANKIIKSLKIPNFIKVTPKGFSEGLWCYGWMDVTFNWMFSVQQIYSYKEIVNRLARFFFHAMKYA